MREKYILRSGALGEDPDAWILGVYFTRSRTNRKRGTLTIGGPKGFEEDMNEVLICFFGFEEGVEDDRVKERQKGMQRKRLVFDVGPLTFRAFLKGVREMMRVGINTTRVTSTGRLMR